MADMKECKHCGASQAGDRETCWNCSRSFSDTGNENEKSIGAIEALQRGFSFKENPLDVKTGLSYEERSEIIRLGYMNVFIPFCLLLCLTGAGAFIGLPLAWYFHSQVKAAPKELVTIGTRLAGGILFRMIMIPVVIIAVVFVAVLALTLSNMQSNGGTFR